MTNLTATFSDGSTDTYKGKRDVTAAWALVNKATGKVVHSGHSLDADKARKTAASNAKQVVYSEAFAWERSHCDKPRRTHAAHAQYAARIAREAGFASWREHYAFHSANIAKAVATNLTIEVVAL